MQAMSADLWAVEIEAIAAFYAGIKNEQSK
jgi:hypothetical protein